MMKMPANSHKKGEKARNLYIQIKRMQKKYKNLNKILYKYKSYCYN